MKDIQKEQIQKAGAIILHSDNSPRVALIYRAKEKDWSFPKGHLEKGETSLDACIREVKEETGLEIEILVQLPNNEYTDKTGSKIAISMYLTQSRSDVFIVEHTEDKIEWVNIYKVKDCLTYDNLKEYFLNILPIIEDKIK